MVRDDIAPLTSVLARAFDADPFINWFVLQDERRQARFEETFRTVLERMSRQLIASFTTPLREGCAVWKRPGEHAIGWREQLGLLPAFGRVMGWRGVPRFVRLMDYSQALHDRFVPEPHFYLFVLGVDPHQQSRGVGSRLLQPILAQCDGENRRAYLETARAENVPFYARHGFHVAHVVEEPGFPKLWLMVRNPSTSADG
jgi:GNAT superfamily N-acetyltransferase